MSKARVQFDAPDLAPVIVAELAADGWRGLTADGEILNVTAHINGAPVAIPESLTIMRGGETIGYRTLPKAPSSGVIEAYQRHLEASNMLVRANEPARALAEIEIALDHARTILARYNRAMILLALGQWGEGFDEFAYCEQNSPLFMRPQYRDAIEAGLTPWQGEDIAGKKLLLINDHGFGDSIMMLRFVPRLKAMGAEVVLLVPPELERLAAQCAPVTCELVEADYVCSLLMLMQVLKLEPEAIPLAPYLKVPPAPPSRGAYGPLGVRKHRRTIGLAWSVGKQHDGDFPRAIPLELLVEHFGRDADLVSVQIQEREQAGTLGVMTCNFSDFGDCAEMMRWCDEIVSVDTAALHLAGAIGHPKITALLSHWHSWRWLSPWYENITFLRQSVPGDWQSALAADRR